ncbi:hypothetical protein GAY31_03710 [Azospirillum brasilense]|nr:hypothetical protein [Azospirillum brasilense]
MEGLLAKLRNGGHTPVGPAAARHADCNPLWTATAVPAAHAAEACLSREHRSRERQADAIGIR